MRRPMPSVVRYVVTALSTGYVLSAAGQVIAFVPNAIGQYALLHHEADPAMKRNQMLAVNSWHSHLWWLATAAQAGRNCDAPQAAGTWARGAKHGPGRQAHRPRAGRQRRYEAVLLGRAGQDLSKYGLRWSHLGFALREAPPMGEVPGRWRVVHKLNACGSDRAAGLVGQVLLGEVLGLDASQAFVEGSDLAPG